MEVNNYRQCLRCVMDTTDREIVFDDEGYCNHCTEFIKRRSSLEYENTEDEETLNRITENIKRAGKGREFDCVIGISGGVDSCYTAYLAKKKGLRILAVHLDNGWNSEEAVQNVKNIASKLDIEYESYVLDWTEFRDIQLAFLKASIPEAETPTDMAIPAALHHYAAKYNVKYILSGGNQATEGILPASWHYNAKDMKYFNYIQSHFGGKKIRKFPTFGFEKELYFKFVRGIRMVYALNYVPYEKESAMEILKSKFDWKFYGGKHYESKYTKFIQSYYLFEKFPIDYRRATLSSQICLGDVKRENALDELKSKPYDPADIEREKRYISKKLQISLDELENIINLPAKWYWDYPNDKQKLNFIYNIYRKYFNYTVNY
ncbi:MAG: N-acetyl sugar amidotransferase [Pyrinomonadaceae bacterium]